LNHPTSIRLPVALRMLLALYREPMANAL